MKNKYLKPALALVLVAAMAVGGSLAYISANTEAYVNTFTMKNGLDVKLEEEFTLNGESLLVDDQGNPIKEGTADFMPGDKIVKNPIVTVTENDLEEGAWLFIEVTGNEVEVANLGFAVDEADSKWIELETANNNDGTTTTVYYQKVNKLSEQKEFPVFAQTSKEIPIVTEEYNDLVEGLLASMELKIEASAIQFANLEDVADAWKALNK